MSDNENNNQNNNNQQQKKPTAASAFKQLNDAKIKAKGEELKKAVEEFVAADKVRDAALEKMNSIEEAIADLSSAKLPN